MPISLERKLEVRRLAERVFDLKSRKVNHIPGRLLDWCGNDGDRALCLLESARAIPADVRIPIAELLAKAENFATDIAKSDEREAKGPPKPTTKSRPVAAKAPAPVAASQE